MKVLKLMSFLLITILVSCTPDKPIVSDEMVMPEPGQIGIYYFRLSVRCESCDAVEEFIKAELGDRYADKVNSGKIVFRQYNMDDPGVADFALDFKVVFKSLIILKDEQRINLTSESFLYAISNPEKLRQVFEETLDKL